jgi:nitrite reductase (NADH) large subunit
MVGDSTDGNWYFDLVREKSDITDLRDMLIFGKDALAETADTVESDDHETQASAAGLVAA